MLTFFRENMINHIEEFTDQDLNPVFLPHLPLKGRSELFSELD